MKFFSTKKDNANKAESTEEIYRPINETSTADSLDDFSLDDLDLDKISETIPADPAKSDDNLSATSLEDDEFSFDDFDLDSLADSLEDTPDTVDTVDTVDTTTTNLVDLHKPEITSASEHDKLDILSELDELSDDVPNDPTTNSFLDSHYPNHTDTLSTEISTLLTENDEIPDFDEMDFDEVNKPEYQHESEHDNEHDNDNEAKPLEDIAVFAPVVASGMALNNEANAIGENPKPVKKGFFSRFRKAKPSPFLPEFENQTEVKTQTEVEPQPLAHETDTTPVIKTYSDDDSHVDMSHLEANHLATSDLEPNYLETSHLESSNLESNHLEPSDLNTNTSDTLVENSTELEPLVPVKKPKSNRFLIILLLLMLLALGAWYYLTQMNGASDATIAPAPAVAPKSKSVASGVASTTVASTANVSTSRVASVTASTANSTPTKIDAGSKTDTASTALPTAVNTISPEEILKPELPKDPAIAKEEMDRLSSQSQQLKEQEVLIEKQLEKMNELSNKKAERIKLLEQQVAHLEQQKNSNNAPAK